MLPVRFNSSLSPVWREFERFMSEDPWFLLRDMEAAPDLRTDQDEHAYRVSVDVPGFTDKDVSVEVHRGTLSISGKRSLEMEGGPKALSRERSTLTFSRTLSLPDTVDEDQVSASVKDGVLVVTLPKRPEVKARAIEVTAH